VPALMGRRPRLALIVVALGCTALSMITQAAAAPERHSAEFQTPSRNIRCLANPTTGWLRCWVMSAGVSYQVNRRGRARRMAGSDAPDAIAPIVGYGSTWAGGIFRCSSRSSGLRCWSRVSGCGFQVARESQRTFCGGSSPPPPPPSRCDASYPTVCIPPPPPDLDCADVPYSDFRVVGRDPHGFDGDGDGVGCET